MNEKGEISMKRCLATLLTIFMMVWFVGFDSNAYNMDDNIKITNITSTSAYVEWSGLISYVCDELAPGSTFTGFDVYLGDTKLYTNTRATSIQLNNIEPGTMHFFYVYVYYVDRWGYSGEHYAFDYFETGDKANINSSTDHHDPTPTPSPSPTPAPTPTPTPSPTPSPSYPTTSVTSLSTPKVSNVEVVNGEVYVKADNIDYRTQKLEWKIYDKKTGKCVKSETSYYTGDNFYGLNARKVYYAVCRAVGYDDDYNEVYSNWSAKKYFVSQPKVTTKSNSKDIKVNSVNIKWKKVTGAKSYTVYAKKKSSSKWVKVKTTTKTSYKLTKIKGKALNLRNSDYNFRIVTNAKVNGKTIKSSNKEWYEAYVY